jgi:hypothetical protein
MAEWQRGWRGPNIHAYMQPATSNSFYSVQLSPRLVNKPRKVHKMIPSTVHWCEYGGLENGHPFSSKDPGKERIVRSKETDKRDQYGSLIVEDEEFYLCGKHANGLFRSGADSAAKEIQGTLDT